MIVLNIGNLIRKLVLLLLFFTIFFTMGEYMYYLNISDNVEINSSVKVLKDLMMCIIVLLAFADSFSRKKVAFIFPVFYLIALNLLLVCLYAQNILLMMVGIRWILPFFLILFLFPYVNEEFIGKVCNVLYGLFIVHVTFQCLELFLMPPVQGINAFGLSSRTPGLFVYPNTGGFFTIICFFSFYFFKRKRLFVLLTLLSLALVMSSAASFMFILICFFLCFYHSKYFSLFIWLLPLLSLFVFNNLDAITGRSEGDTTLSGGIRLDIFLENFMEADVIPKTFGTATNTAMMMKLDNGFIADVTYTSILVNMGIVFFVFSIGLIFYGLIYAFFNKKLDLILFLLIYTLYGFSTIVSEIFPMNLLMAVYGAYFIKRERLSNIILKKKYIG